MRSTKRSAVVVVLVAIAGLLVAGTASAEPDPATPVVIAWGQNDYGQTDVPAGLTDVVAVDAGTRHSLALKSDGTVVAWGDNGGGQTDVPSDLTDVVAVSAGGDHSLALKSDGTVVVWGGLTPYEFNGQTGTVGELYGYIPVPPGLTDVVAIEAGGSTNLVLRSDGTTFGWGYVTLENAWDDAVDITLGPGHSYILRSNGELTYRCMFSGSCEAGLPWEVGPLTDVTAGSSHALGLRPDGTVVQWGAYGQYFDWVPAGLSGVASVEAGGNQFYALGVEGALTGWGYGGAPIAAMPSGLGRVLDVSAGLDHTLAIVEPSTADVTPPSASIASPVDGATHDLGEVVAADFSCTDDVGVASCLGTVASGDPIDTSSPGAATFEVLATDTTGNTSSASAAYTVSNDLAAGLALSGSFTSIPVGYGVSLVDEGVDGVTVTVSGAGSDRVEMSVCGGFTVRIAPGSSVTLACGSVIATVHVGAVEVEVATALGPVTVDVPEGATAEVEDDGSVTVTGDVPVTVTAAGVTQSVTSGQGLAVRIAGFRQPVDNGGVLNSVKGGSTVPVKFEVFYGSLELVDVAAVASLTTTRIPCPGGTPVDSIEELAATNAAGLRYSSGDGFFIANWKAPSAKGTCQRLTVTTSTGATLSALFSIR